MRWFALFGLLTACTATEDDTFDASSPSYHGYIAPLLTEHCARCHQAGAVAPFAVTNYAEAAEWARPMLAALEGDIMPPFDARDGEDCTPELGFQHDNRLTAEEIEAFRQWVEADAQEGDPATAAPLPQIVTDDLTDPDAIVRLAQPFAVDGDDDIYQCFRVEVPTDETVWLTGLQVLPDNDKVVHHVLVWSDHDDQSADLDDGDGYRCSGFPGFYPTELVAAWAPGGAAMRVPDNTGVLFERGRTLVVNVHYHPTGAGVELDQTELAITWTTEKPAEYVTWFLVDEPFGAEVQPGPSDSDGVEFRIPADDPAHTETLILDPGDNLPFDLTIYAVAPHMHYLGSAMDVKVLRADGSEECLVNTPRYRFDWQSTYFYKGPLRGMPRFRAGDRLQVRCTYDNSWDNPYMPRALAADGRTETTDVRWGEDSSSEMCMAMLGLITPPRDITSIFGRL